MCLSCQLSSSASLPRGPLGTARGFSACARLPVGSTVRMMAGLLTCSTLSASRLEPRAMGRQAQTRTSRAATSRAPSQARMATLRTSATRPAGRASASTRQRSVALAASRPSSLSSRPPTFDAPRGSRRCGTMRAHSAPRAPGGRSGACARSTACPSTCVPSSSALCTPPRQPRQHPPAGPPAASMHPADPSSSLSWRCATSSRGRSGTTSSHKPLRPAVRRRSVRRCQQMASWCCARICLTSARRPLLRHTMPHRMVARRCWQQHSRSVASTRSSLWATQRRTSPPLWRMPQRALLSSSSRPRTSTQECATQPPARATASMCRAVLRCLTASRSRCSLRSCRPTKWACAGMISRRSTRPRRPFGRWLRCRFCGQSCSAAAI
mmetsp:Transcript_2851/g.7487  ORF Transcript_2851/g.7487 Transcript_2851/m.7487 type:complete len:382 (+) Transcript_2851:823-1968(+)